MTKVSYWVWKGRYHRARGPFGGGRSGIVVETGLERREVKVLPVARLGKSFKRIAFDDMCEGFVSSYLRCHVRRSRRGRLSQSSPSTDIGRDIVPLSPL